MFETELLTSYYNRIDNFIWKYILYKFIFCDYENYA